MTVIDRDHPRLLCTPEESCKPNPLLPVVVGQRVEAISIVYDLPGKLADAHRIHAHPGELGTVVNIDGDGAWPTVEWDMGGTTEVTSEEAKPLEDLDDADVAAFIAVGDELFGEISKHNRERDDNDRLIG